MSKKKPVKKGLRAASKTGGKRRAKFQPYRLSDGKRYAVVTKKREEEQGRWSG